MAESICVGYARVSSKDQNEERQIKMLKEAGVPERYIFIDKESGRDYNRDKWNAMMTVIRKGDTVFVCSLDRLGRNYTETGNSGNISRRRSVQTLLSWICLFWTPEKQTT